MPSPEPTSPDHQPGGMETLFLLGSCAIAYKVLKLPLNIRRLQA